MTMSWEVSRVIGSMFKWLDMSEVILHSKKLCVLFEYVWNVKPLIRVGVLDKMWGLVDRVV